MTLPPDQDTDGGLPTQQIWIAAGIGAVVLAIGVAVALGTSGGKDGASAGPTVSTRPPSSSPTLVMPTPSYSSSFPPASPRPPATVSASPAGSSVRWRGTVTVRGPSDHRDLDAVPPAASERDSDLSGDWLTPVLKADDDRVRFALASGAPGRDRCRGLLGATGVDETDTLQDGAVVCVLTSQGRVARLRVVEAAQTSTRPIVRVAVTVWDPPAG